MSNMDASTLITAAYNPSKGKLLACTAASSSLQLCHSDDDKFSVALPSPASAICSGDASGLVVIGTEDGTILMIPPEGKTTKQLYQHPNKKKVDVVAISEDDDTIVATFGLEVVLISRVLLSTVLPLATTSCMHVPNQDEKRVRGPCKGFHSIALQGDVILLCEAHNRGGIVVIQGGKYLCRLAGTHEKEHRSPRAFRFVGCGVVQSEAVKNSSVLSKKEQRKVRKALKKQEMMVVGMENWGSFCVWSVPTETSSTASLEVKRHFDLPMRSTVAKAFCLRSLSILSLHTDKVSFAISYVGASIMRTHRKKLKKEDPGWVSVFAVPLRTLQEAVKSVDPPSFVRGVYDADARRLKELEQIDLDVFQDRLEDQGRQVSFLRMTLNGSLVHAGLEGGSPCFRLFTKDPDSESFSCSHEVPPVEEQQRDICGVSDGSEKERAKTTLLGNVSEKKEPNGVFNHDD